MPWEPCEDYSRLATRSRTISPDEVVVRQRRILAVSAAEVGAGTAAFCFAELGFLAFVFGELFFGIRRVGIARGEHGIGAAGFLFLLAEAAELVAHLTKSDIDRFDFHKKIADFFQKVMKVIGPHDVGHARRFKSMNVLAASHGWNHIEHPKAAAVFMSDRSKFAKDGEHGPLDINLRDVGDDERPFGALEFAHEQADVLKDADAPAFGVENLAESRGADGVVIEHEDADLARLGNLRRARHLRSIAPGEEGECEKGNQGT